jgi:hypothetical protein
VVQNSETDNIPSVFIWCKSPEKWGRKVVLEYTYVLQLSAAIAKYLK